MKIRPTNKYKLYQETVTEKSDGTKITSDDETYGGAINWFNDYINQS